MKSTPSSNIFICQRLHESHHNSVFIFHLSKLNCCFWSAHYYCVCARRTMNLSTNFCLIKLFLFQGWLHIGRYTRCIYRQSVEYWNENTKNSIRKNVLWLVFGLENIFVFLFQRSNTIYIIDCHFNHQVIAVRPVRRSILFCWRGRKAGLLMQGKLR